MGLRQTLRRAPSALDSPGRRLSACFCLFVSEWWRREYPGGPWAWASPMAEIGWEDVRYESLLALTERGLGFWRRKIHQGDVSRAFLGTLAREGGLPIRLVKDDAPLRRYLKLLMQDFKLFGKTQPEELPRFAAERGEAFLPRTFRHDSIYDVALQLASAVLALGGRLTDTSPEGLRRAIEAPEYRGWREQLPLSLDDDAAVQLVGALLGEAAALGSGEDRLLRVRTLCLLSESGGDAQLRRQLDSSVGCSLTRVADLLRQPLDRLPGRFDLVGAREDGTAQNVASFARYGDRYRITLTQMARDLQRAPDEVGLWSVIGDELVDVELPGAGALAPQLPWIFVPTGDDTRGRIWELGAMGGLRTAHPTALVALPPSFRVERRDGAEAMPYDARLEARVLFRVSGHVVLRGPEGDYAVRTKVRVQDDTSGQYLLFGQRWDVDTSILAEMPTIRRVRADGTIVTVAQQELSWRPVANRSAWSPWTKRARGAIRIRHAVNGEIFAELTAAVAPEKAVVTLRPSGANGGLVTLTGFDGATCGLRHTHPAGGEVMARRVLDGGVEMELGASVVVPTAAHLEARWPGDLYLHFSVPFPVTGCRFIARSGTELRGASRSTPPSLAVTRMGGVIAEGRSHKPGALFQIRGQLSSFDESSEDRWGGFDRDLVGGRDRVSHRLDLGVLQARTQRVLCFSDDLMALLQLRIEGGVGWAPRLAIRRFAGAVSFDHATLRYQVTNDDLAETATADRVEALNLEAPTNRVPLERDEDDWRLPEDLPPGMWFVIAFAGDWAGWRPKVVIVSDRGAVSEGSEPSAAETSDVTREWNWEDPDAAAWEAARLAAAGTSIETGAPPVDLVALATRTKKPRHRMERFAELVREMVGDLGHPGWERFDAYIQTGPEIPPVVFDFVRSVARDDEAVLTALFRSPRDELERLWNAFDSVGVTWETIPVRFWLRAAVAHHARITAVSQILEPSLRDTLTRDALALLEQDRLPPRQKLPSLSVVNQLAQYIIRGISTPETALLVDAAPTPLEQVLLHARKEAYQRLLQNMANAEWPQSPALDGMRSHLALSPTLSNLLIDTPHKRQWDLVNVPLIAAIASVTGRRLSRAVLFQVRVLADSHRDWFETAYLNTLALAIRAALADPGLRHNVVPHDD
jgi:hypothetical protein